MDNFEFNCELQALICEREGMIAENKQRETLGQLVPYSEYNFSLLEDKFLELKTKWLKRIKD